MKHKLIAGVDEAGRGPLAGPVVAAAVVLPNEHGIVGIDDSKKLSAERRDELADVIRSRAIAWFVAESNVDEIDQLNILHATMLAMKRAVEGLTMAPDLVLIDGNRAPDLAFETRTEIKGDARFEVIGAASILAKTHRDNLMQRLDKNHPGYGWSSNKGYPTKSHIQALRERGVTEFHRRSFAPVRTVLEESL